MPQPISTERRDGTTRRIVTVFSNQEYGELQAYAKKHKLSLYSLAKKAIRDFIRRNP